MWRIKAPPKAKHLLWWICRGCLPTRDRLRQHYVQCPIICHLCEGGVEDERRVFFCCAHSSQCWNVAGLGDIILCHLQTFNEAKTVIQDICSKKDKMVAERVTVMLWVLWNNINSWVTNNEEANKLGMQTFHSWKDWFMTQNIKTQEEIFW